MKFSQKINEVQAALREQRIDGWLLCDFRGNNSLIYPFLEIPSDRFLTRRFYYWIPQMGNPAKIVSLIEPHALDHLPGETRYYRTWQDLEAMLCSITAGNKTIAMEYSPNNSIPVISKVDAGTIDLIRSNGAQVVSSANILQRYTSVWSEEQLESHLMAASVLDSVVELTWGFIRESLRSNRQINEYEVQQFMLDEMIKRGCVVDHPPICAVNENSADPHYGPLESSSKPICPDDFILLDLWCKQDRSHAVYADIARVGVAASHPTPLQQQIFDIVKNARHKGVDFITSHMEDHKEVQGWQVDQICRDFIHQSGYGEFFIHRTGHNIGEAVHGSGANLDNFETHDFRCLLPGTCFSVEPGIYLPGQFGVRLEYDVYLYPEGKVLITGGIQTEIICLLS